jgi:hypothetical protein
MPSWAGQIGDGRKPPTCAVQGGVGQRPLSGQKEPFRNAKSTTYDQQNRGIRPRRALVCRSLCDEPEYRSVAQLRVGAASDHGRIPLLDIGPFLTGDSGARCRARLRVHGLSHGRRSRLASFTTPLLSHNSSPGRRPTSWRLRSASITSAHLPFGGQSVRHFARQHEPSQNYIASVVRVHFSGSLM